MTYRNYWRNAIERSDDLRWICLKGCPAHLRGVDNERVATVAKPGTGPARSDPGLDPADRLTAGPSSRLKACRATIDCQQGHHNPTR